MGIVDSSLRVSVATEESRGKLVTARIERACLPSQRHGLSQSVRIRIHKV